MKLLLLCMFVIFVVVHVFVMESQMPKIELDLYFIACVLTAILIRLYGKEK